MEQVVKESLPSLVDASQGHTSPNLAKGLATLDTHSGSTAVEGLEARAEGLLPSLASESLKNEVHAVLPPLGSHVPAIGDLVTPQRAIAGSSSVIEETVHAIEPSAGNPIALVGGAASAVAAGDTASIKAETQALVLARVRAIGLSYLAKLPIVGAYFKRDSGPNIETLVTETTPLLGAIRDPKAFATQQAEGLLRRLLSPVSSRLPDIDALDNAESDNTLFRISVECYVLARDGSGWLL